MSIALNAAVSAAQIAKIRIEVLSNDIANKSTTGYKALDVRTGDLPYTSFAAQASGSQEEGAFSQIQVGNGAKVVSTTKILRQGDPRLTNQPLDMMINGSGYFVIALPNGSRAYTRDGSFTLDKDSMLTTKTGERVVGEGGEIEIKGNLSTFEVDSTGSMSIIDASGKRVKIGRIILNYFNNEQALEAIGNNMCVETFGSGTYQEIAPGEHGSGKILNKALESSNVDPIKVVMDLLEAQNSYEIAFRIIEVVNKIERKANDIITV